MNKPLKSINNNRIGIIKNYSIGLISLLGFSTMLSASLSWAPNEDTSVNGGGTWSTSAISWQSGSDPRQAWVNGSNAVLGRQGSATGPLLAPAGDYTITIDGSITAGQIRQMSETGAGLSQYTLTGGTINLSDGGGSAGFRADQGTLTVNSDIVYTGSDTQRLEGNLVLGGNNNVTNWHMRGTTTLNSANALGGNGSLLVDANFATLALNGFSVHAGRHIGFNDGRRSGGISNSSATAVTIAGNITTLANNFADGNRTLSIAGPGVIRHTGAITGGSDVGAETIQILNGGKFILDGDGSGYSGNFNVLAGAYIGGEGSLGTDLALASGAGFLFDPDSTLTVTGAVTVNGLGIGHLLSADGTAVDWSTISNGTYELINGTISGSLLHDANNPFNLGDGRQAYFQLGSPFVLTIGTASSRVLRQSRITAPDISQERPPRLLLNADLLNEIREHLQAGVEPRFSAWNHMRMKLEEALSTPFVNAVYTGDDPSRFYQACQKDSELARDLAIAYQLSGDERFAARALEMLNAWIEPEPLPGSAFDPEKGVAGTAMLLARSMMQFVQVYDLLYGHPDFSRTSKQRTELWFRMAAERMKQNYQVWRENDYFNHQYFQNHYVSDMMGILMIGYALGDEEMVRYALDSEDNPRDYNNLLNGMILTEGERGYFREPGGWPVQNGEIIDRYRHFAIAGHTFDYITRPHRGLQYAHLSLLQMVIAAQVAHSNGLDLFNQVGNRGESLRASLEFYSDFYRLHDSGMKGGFYFGECDRIGTAGDGHGLWELAHFHYPDSQPIYELLVSIDRPEQNLWLVGNPALLFGRPLVPLVAESVPLPKEPIGAYPKSAAQSPYRIRVPVFKKDHPRLLMDETDIKIMRERVQANQSPFVDAWHLMRDELESLLADNRQANPYVGEDGGPFYLAANRDSGIARDFALAYHITGDERYASAAIDYLRQWALAEPMPATRFDPEIGFPNTGMGVARASFGFLWAYDLLYHHPKLEPSDHANIQHWFRHLERVVHEGIRRWEENDYFGQQDFQNHIGSHIMGLVAIAITLGDRELLQYAVDAKANPRDFLDYIEGAILMQGQRPHHRERGNHRVQSGEIYDRYRHQTGKGMRGLQYANLSLLKMSVTAEMLYHHGLDMYGYAAPTGERIELPFSFYSDFYRLMDSTIKGGFYSGECERIGRAGDSPALFELGLRRYPNNPKLIELISTMDRASQSIWLLGRPVLTHGLELPH